MAKSAILLFFTLGLSFFPCFQATLCVYLNLSHKDVLKSGYGIRYQYVFLTTLISFRRRSLVGPGLMKYGHKNARCTKCLEESRPKINT